MVIYCRNSDSIHIRQHDSESYTNKLPSKIRRKYDTSIPTQIRQYRWPTLMCYIRYHWACPFGNHIRHNIFQCFLGDFKKIIGIKRSNQHTWDNYGPPQVKCWHYFWCNEFPAFFGNAGNYVNFGKMLEIKSRRRRPSLTHHIFWYYVHW